METGRGGIESTIFRITINLFSPLNSPGYLTIALWIGFNETKDHFGIVFRSIFPNRGKRA